MIFAYTAYDKSTRKCMHRIYCCQCCVLWKTEKTSRRIVYILSIWRNCNAFRRKHSGLNERRFASVKKSETSPANTSQQFKPVNGVNPIRVVKLILSDEYKIINPAQNRILKTSRCSIWNRCASDHVCVVVWSSDQRFDLRSKFDRPIAHIGLSKLRRKS